MDDRYPTFACRNCGREIDPRKKFCDLACEDNYEEEKVYAMERAEEEAENQNQK